jgi:hypothetical protein
VVVRARRSAGRRHDSVVKLARSCRTRSRRRAAELRRRGGSMPRRARLLGVHEGVARQERCARVHPGRPALFTKGSGASTRSTRWRRQRARRPDHAPGRSSKARPPPGYNRRMVAEVWLYPDDSRILELSTKCTPRRRSRVRRQPWGVPSSLGITLTGEQQTRRKALEFFSAGSRRARSPR